MSYFAGCWTEAQVRAEYRRLALRWHPDRPGGNVAIMQQVNVAYEAALAALRAGTWTPPAGQPWADTPGPTGPTLTRNYSASILARMGRMLGLGMDADIWTDGRRVYARGNTRPYREDLRRMGARWDAGRQAWAW